MPLLNPADPLFTDHQELILASIGVARSVRPNIDLPAICRFDGPKSVHYVSDGDRGGTMLYGVQLFDDAPPKVGFFHRAELQLLKRRGRLYRADLMASLLTVNELARAARDRLVRGINTLEVLPD